jgi:hypothetical protein
MALHPAFESAPPRRRFRGRLFDLRIRLVFEALRRPPHHSSWAIVPNGACILWHAPPGGLMEVRISRDKPTSDPAAWEREIDTFAKHLALGGWERRRDPEATGEAVILTEPLALLDGGEALT